MNLMLLKKTQDHDRRYNQSVKSLQRGGCAMLLRTRKETS